MQNNSLVAVLPIGEIDSDLVRREVESIIAVFARQGAELSVADAASNEDTARQLAQNLAGKNPDLLLIITLRGLSAPLIETAVQAGKTPCLIWPVQGRFALPSSALATGALLEAGFPVDLHYAPPEHSHSMEVVHTTLRAAKAYSRLRRSRIGVIGGLFPNLVSCRYDPSIVHARLGVTIVPVSYEEVSELMAKHSSDRKQMAKQRQEINQSFKVNPADLNALDPGISLHTAMKQIAQTQSLDGFATECWTGLPKRLGLNPCLGFIDDSFTLACEGDIMLCISLLVVRYLTGSSAYAGDLYDVDLDGNLTLIHCGGPASLAAQAHIFAEQRSGSDPNSGGNAHDHTFLSKKEPSQQVVLAKSQLALERGFETMTCRPRMDPGPVTLLRYYGQNCDQMHVATGELLSCDTGANLTVKIKLGGDRWDFLKECYGNHYIVVPGDIRHELALLSKWLSITIHNT